MKTEDIRHLASLARLDLSEEERDLFPQQIEDILAFVNQISERDLPETVVRDMRRYNVFREDEVVPSASREAIVAQFPEEEKDMLRVSQILP